jgi:hypothetical protein
MRIAFFADQPNPKWTDETLPVEVRKQILADELRRVTRLSPGPSATETARSGLSQRAEHAS